MKVLHTSLPKTSTCSLNPKAKFLWSKTAVFKAQTFQLFLPKWELRSPVERSLAIEAHLGNPQTLLSSNLQVNDSSKTCLTDSSKDPRQLKDTSESFSSSNKSNLKLFLRDLDLVLSNLLSLSNLELIISRLQEHSGKAWTFSLNPSSQTDLGLAESL